MKKIGQNIVIFLIILGITYLQPVFFPFSQEKTEQAPVTTNMPKQSQPKMLKAEGFARYIYQPFSKLYKKLGSYQKVYAVDDGTWYQFHQPGIFVQALVRHQKVEALLVMGDKAPVNPFKMNMTADELASNIEMMTNFQLKVHQKTYDIEIPEEELVASPFIEYKGGIYSFLQFNHLGQLKGIFYGDATLFIKNMPYRLTSGKMPISVVQNDKIWEAKAEMSQSTFAYLLGNTTVDEALNKQAQSILKQFKTHLNKYVSEEEQILYQQAFEGTIEADETLFLSQKALKDLTSKQALMMATGKDSNVALFHYFYERVGQEDDTTKSYHLGTAHIGEVQLFIVEEV